MPGVSRTHSKQRIVIARSDIEVTWGHSKPSLLVFIIQHVYVIGSLLDAFAAYDYFKVTNKTINLEFLHRVIGFIHLLADEYEII